MRRDFEEYLVQLQKQYTEMNKELEKVNKQIQDGMLTSEAAQGLQNYFNIINANYQRVLYCRYLYNLPPKFIQKLQKKKLEKQAKKFMEEQADQETVVNENNECLDAIKEVSDKEGQNGGVC